MTLDTTRPLLGQSARQPARRVVGRLLRLLVAAAVLAYLFHRVSPSYVLDAMASTRPVPLLAAFLTAFASQLTVAARLKRLADVHELKLSLFEVLEINLATLFYGLFLPAGNFTGIAVRFYKMSKPQKNYAGTVVSLFFDRMVATINLCVVGVVFWLVDFPPDSWPILVLLLSGLAILLTVYAAVFLPLPLPMVADLQRRIGSLLPRQLEAIRRAMRTSRALPRSALMYVFALSILAQLLGIVAYRLVASSLDLDIWFLSIGWMRSTAMLLATLPVSVAGLGVREGTLFVLLSHYGIAAGDALAFSVLVFAATILPVALIGGLSEVKRLLL